MSVIQAHTLELLSFLAVVLATGTVAVLGWGPLIRMETKPIVASTSPSRTRS